MCKDVEECWSGEGERGVNAPRCRRVLEWGGKRGVNAPRCRRVLEWGGERGLMHHEVGQCRGG